MKRRLSQGFGIMEILVAVVVLSFGLSAVAKLHTTIIASSSDNKLRYQAVAIAKSRLEDLRNYAGDVTDQDEFIAAYPASAFTNSTAVVGNAADYTRTERTVLDGEIRALTVKVTWLDSTGTTKTVELDTEISWKNPRSAGDFLIASDEPLVASATGRARLGDGTLDAPVPPGLLEGGKLNRAELGNGELGLIASDGETVVLTLEDACASVDVVCTDFVEINGRIFIDTASQRNLDPGDIFIQASDAAFCQRYYIDANGDAVEIINSSSSAITSNTGDYEYFDYRCYVGGGWHGNIGILLSGGISQGDKICMGDPNSVNSWEQPVIAARRSYRGMLYKASSQKGAPLVKELIDNTSRIKYYTQGVADSMIFPAPGDPGHDFVISSMATSLTSGDNCVSQGVMVRPDSNIGGTDGDLFSGMPADFICLNDGLAGVETSPPMLDGYEWPFGADFNCPYDPTDPPITAHSVTGTVDVDTTLTDIELDTELTAVQVNTSDGIGNCELAAFSGGSSPYSAAYDCTVFDWGNGWTGYIETKGNITKMTCTPSQNSFTSLTADQVVSTPVECLVGEKVVVLGDYTVSPRSNRRAVFSEPVISPGGNCSVNTDTLQHSCESDIFAAGVTTWSGTITYAMTGGVFCSATDENGEDSTDIAVVTGDTTATATYSNITSGSRSINFVVASQANKCD
jgi:Tfp pilus assembly protein PilV